MQKYKPEFMGKVLPADDQAKLTDFVTNKYDAFSQVYDTCKNQAAKIDTITSLTTPSTPDNNSLSVKVSTDKETMEKIKESNTNDSVTVNGDVITATGKK